MLIALFLFCLGTPKAQAGALFWGGALRSSPSSTGLSPPPFSAGWGYQGGIGLDAGLGGVALEIDALYLNRVFNDLVNGTAQMKVIRMPALIRLSFDPFTLGAGLFAETGIGSVHGGGGGSASYSAYGMRKSEYGWVTLAGFKFDLGFADFLIDGRFSNGLRDVSGYGPQTQIFQRDLSILAGLRLGL